jgi:hypothetical protein
VLDIQVLRQQNGKCRVYALVQASGGLLKKSVFRLEQYDGK